MDGQGPPVEDAIAVRVLERVSCYFVVQVP